MIAKETQEQIKALVRVEDVVGDFVRLKRSGPRYIGLCPFHDERTPSFVVSPALGIFKCFGCGKAGDGIGFIMEHERLSYEEALKWLARRYNVEIKESEVSPEMQAEERLRESLFLVNDFALRHFRENLFAEPAVGLAYLKERGLSDAVIEKFQLGYAPPGRYFLRDALKAAGYQEEIALKVGLLKKREENGEIYDTFRDRVIFPIHSLTGRVLGFGGRILKPSDKAPKYLNSPESEIYLKSRTLYGLHLARKAIAHLDNCYLAEGYMDVIALHQAGIENVVASSGTSLTEEQIKLIRRFTNKVTLLYDGDRAGILAALRGADLMLEHGLQVRLVLFPEGEDPDSYARKLGPGAFAAFLQSAAQDIVGFKARLLLDQAGDDALKRAEALRKIVESIALIPDGFARNELALKMARMAAMEERLVIFELNRARRQYLEKKSNTPATVGARTVDTPPEQQPTQPEPPEYPEEKALIRWLILYGHLKIKYFAPSQEEGIPIRHHSSVWRFVRQQLAEDNYQFLWPLGDVALGLLESYFENPDHQFESAFDYLLKTASDDLRKAVIELCADAEDRVSPGWEQRFGVGVTHERDLVSSNTLHLVNALREERVKQFLKVCREDLKHVQDEKDHYLILKKIMAWEQTKKEISETLGRVVLE
jgi:DNA primase